MGMSTGGSKGGVQSDINITPLIDVLLVLLIIFLVVMPIMMKKEALEVPHALDPGSMIDPGTLQLTIAVKNDGSFVFDDGDRAQPIALADIATTLRAKLAGWRTGQEKFVFVDFDDKVGWKDVISTMDTIRSLAADVDHDEIKVALKVKEPPAGQPAP